MEKIRKGTKVIYPIWDKTAIATVNYFNPFSKEVGLRYKGEREKLSQVLTT